MDRSGRLIWLRDARLTPLAADPLPSWLWSADASRVLWANPTGAAILGAPNAAALANRRFDAGQPVAAQVAQLATTLTPGNPPQLEKLRGFGAGVGRALACHCSHVTLDDDTRAILIVANEHAGPDLPLNERMHRLLAGVEQPIAVFGPDGPLIEAAVSARARLNGAETLAAFGLETLAAQAMTSGYANGETARGPIALHRIGGNAGTVLIADLDAPLDAEHTVPPAAAEPMAHAKTTPTLESPPSHSEPPSESPPQRTATTMSPAPSITTAEAPERRHPLRFVWQMDAENSFTVGSDEFVALIGPRTAAHLGRPWREMAAELGLDPEGHVARAIATRATWSGLTVAWPVDSGGDPLMAELSGLPVFDRDRIFRGYRGFGVCRDLARLGALIQARDSRTDGSAPAAIAIPSETESTARDKDVPPNILPFRAQAETGLSPVERRAFRDLALRLTERLTAAGVGTDAQLLTEDDGVPEPLPANGSPLSDIAQAASAASAESAADAGADLSDFDELFDEAAELPAGSSRERSILDRLPVGVLVYRLNQLLYANRAFLELTGYPSLAALTAAGGLDALFVQPEAVALEQGSGAPFTVSSHGGGQVPLEGRLLRIPWDNDSAFALVTSNVTRPESNTGQHEVQELKSILDTATDGVIVLEPSGRVLSANRSAQALFGYEAAEFAGRDFASLFAPESERIALDYLDDLVRDEVASVLNGGREVIGRVREGGLIPLFMTVGRISGGAEKFCAVFRDISPWKKSEEALTEAKRQAEKASSAKSDFLAKISHEIRTPLNAIIGFSEVMMEERFGPVGNDRYRQYLKDIHTSGGHLLSLINDLLDLSKIEAGKLELSFANIALNDLTAQCVAIMQPQANRERVIIRTSLSPKLPEIAADARSVRQIVLNLLSNSIKFTTAGGQVIVSTALTETSDVVLRVRDTGIGMSEKDIAAALEPFRQLAIAGRLSSGGTGLGLPLTKALAEANRAGFHIRSAPNTGTLVEITFRTAQVAAE